MRATPPLRRKRLLAPEPGALRAGDFAPWARHNAPAIEIEASDAVPRLPPLECLHFFEAAARRESFKHAADELGVTPPAVGHRIRKLESHLGVTLFDRGPRGVRLNGHGRTYLAEIQGLLDDIRTVSERHRLSGGTRRIKVVSVESVADRWLMPRLAGFKAAHPEVAVEIETNHRGFERARRTFDGWLAYVGDTATPHPNVLHGDPLYDEFMFPVCSPRMLDEFGDPQGPADIQRWPLLYDLAWEQDWERWFACQGEQRPDLANAWGFRLYSMVIQAAVAGMGAAIGRSALIRPELDNGSLVPIFQERAAPTARCCFLTTRQSARNPDVQAFKAWLLDSFANERTRMRIAYP